MLSLEIILFFICISLALTMIMVISDFPENAVILKYPTYQTSFSKTYSKVPKAPFKPLNQTEAALAIPFRGSKSYAWQINSQECEQMNTVIDTQRA